MINKMTERLEFQGNALLLRAERQRTIASNIANADTPGYVARDFHFANALREATEGGKRLGDTRMALAPVTHTSHAPLPTVEIGNTRTGTNPRRHGLCRTDATQPGQQHRRPGPRARQLGR